MNKHPLTYKNKKVYIGMDVHKKSYTLSAYYQGQVVKTATTPADPGKRSQSTETMQERCVRKSVTASLVCLETGL